MLNYLDLSGIKEHYDQSEIPPSQFWKDVRSGIATQWNIIGLLIYSQTYFFHLFLATFR